MQDNGTHQASPRASENRKEILTDSFPMLIGLSRGAVGTKEELKLFVSDLRPSPMSDDSILIVERYFKETFLATT